MCRKQSIEASLSLPLPLLLSLKSIFLKHILLFFKGPYIVTNTMWCLHPTCEHSLSPSQHTMSQRDQVSSLTNWLPAPLPLPQATWISYWHKQPNSILMCPFHPCSTVIHQLEVALPSWALFFHLLASSDYKWQLLPITFLIRTSHKQFFCIIPHQKIFFPLTFRQGGREDEREGEKDQCERHWFPPILALTRAGDEPRAGDGTRNPGTRLDQELNCGLTL